MRKLTTAQQRALDIIGYGKVTWYRGIGTMIPESFKINDNGPLDVNEYNLIDESGYNINELNNRTVRALEKRRLVKIKRKNRYENFASVEATKVGRRLLRPI